MLLNTFNYNCICNWSNSGRNGWEFSMHSACNCTCFDI